MLNKLETIVKGSGVLKTIKAVYKDPEIMEQEFKEFLKVLESTEFSA
jgi:hypothetical protein